MKRIIILISVVTLNLNFSPVHAESISKRPLPVQSETIATGRDAVNLALLLSKLVPTASVTLLDGEERLSIQLEIQEMQMKNMEHGRDSVLCIIQVGSIGSQNVLVDDGSKCRILVPNSNNANLLKPDLKID